jgi:hypothetical protein
MSKRVSQGTTGAPGPIAGVKLFHTFANCSHRSRVGSDTAALDLTGGHRADQFRGRPRRAQQPQRELKKGLPLPSKQTPTTNRPAIRIGIATRNVSC